MPLTATRIDAIRNAACAALGAIFLLTGLWTLATGRVPPLPSWSCAAAGIAVAAVLVGVGAVSPRGACLAAHDEGSAAAWLRAPAFGYCAATARPPASPRPSSRARRRSAA